jgi:hypothetical protein
MTKKWLTLSALLAGSAMLMEGCLGAFWDGLWNSAWPTNNQWINIGLDILNEELFG